MQRKSCLLFQVYLHWTGYRWDENRDVLKSMFQDKGLHLLLNFWAVEHIRIHGTGKETNSKSFRSFLLCCIAKPCHSSLGDLQLWYLWWTELVGTSVQLLLFPYNDNCCTGSSLWKQSTLCWWSPGLNSHRPLHHQRHMEIKNSNILAWPNTHKWHSYWTLLLFSVRPHPA